VGFLSSHNKIDFNLSFLYHFDNVSAKDKSFFSINFFFRKIFLKIIQMITEISIKINTSSQPKYFNSHHNINKHVVIKNQNNIDTKKARRFNNLNIGF
jgi:hypothetical protein